MAISTQTTKHAIVSGGCSGIGLDLVRHLLSHPEHHWKVVVADINPTSFSQLSPPLDPDRTLFVETDVADWTSHANVFKRAFEWSGGKINFYAANAGCGDKESFYAPSDVDKDPEKPNLTCVDVCEVAVMYGLKLFIHYSRKTRQALGDEKASFKPKMVITASCAGLYPFAIAPQYAAAKAACVALARTVGDSLYASDGIAVNCICPAFLKTGILPGNLGELWPQEWITPTSTTTRAFQELIDEEGKVKSDGKSDGKDGQVKVGQAVEVVVEKLFYRDPVEYADESQRFLIEDAKKADGLWMTSILSAGRKSELGS